MIQEKKNTPYLLLGVLLACAGLAVGAFWDLPIDVALHSDTFMPAIFMEAFGYYPLYLPVALWGMCLVLNRALPYSYRAGGLLLAVAPAAILPCVSANNLVKRGLLSSPHLLNAIGIGLVILGLFLWVIQARASEETRKKLQFIGLWGTVYMALDNVAINILKLIWNRTRYDDMAQLGNFDAFTSWLHPFGNGGTSFPSGHTAAACSVLVLILLCDVFAVWAKRRGFVFSFCFVYIAFMALCRIMIGRHFISDTAMATLVMLLLFWGMTRSKYYTTSLAKLKTNV